MRRSFTILLVAFTCIASAQMTTQDSALLVDIGPFKQQIKESEVEDDRFLEKLNEICDSYPQSDYNKGIRAHLEGCYWDFKGKADKALQLYSIADGHFEKCCTETLDYIENDIRIGFVSIHSGLINFDTLHFQKGYNHVVDGYNRARKYNFTETALRMLDFKGDYHYYSAFRIQDFAKALAFYNQLEKELEGTPDSTYRFIDSKLNLANVHRRLENIELSEKYFAEAMTLAEKYDFNRILYSSHIDKAEVYEETGDYKQALKLKLIAYPYAQKVNDKEIINRANRQLYYTYKNLKQYDEALNFLELHFEGVREMNKAEALQLQAKLENQKEFDQQALEIVRLENVNLNTSRNFLIVLALLSLTALASFAYAYRKEKVGNRKLIQKNNEITLAQMKGQKIERKRMAGELHDNLNTKIAAVRYRLEAQSISADEQTVKLIDGTLNLIDDIYEDIRLISHNLVPETVEELGLIPSLQKLINSLNDNDLTTFHLISKFTSERDLKDISYELYNIVFEMINNILKHAEAKNAWISVSYRNDKLHVSVNDDGKGFSVAENMGGFGLKSISSRVEKLNGQFNIESTAEAGTKYLIEIPLGQ